MVGKKIKIKLIINRHGDWAKIDENTWVGPWLFPTFDSGVNGSQALSPKEAETFISDAQVP